LESVSLETSAKIELLSRKVTLDSCYSPAYNPFTSEVVSEKHPIEKEMYGGSLHGKSSLKSSDRFAEEILVKLDRHGYARYSMD
jgi:hypothetical protein